MNALTTAQADAIDLVASTLIHRASRLTRLLTSFGSRELSRTEAGLLITLLDGPRRITELAETEALAQPTVTRLVDRLENRGFVVRARAADDGRVVLVSISSTGRTTIEASRVQVRTLMRETMADLRDEELTELVGATETLAKLIETLQLRRAGV
ncbi:MAG: MarR family winged helix-turn-helix transcriptional regulator [Frankia sp.]